MNISGGVSARERQTRTRRAGSSSDFPGRASHSTPRERRSDSATPGEMSRRRAGFSSLLKHIGAELGHVEQRCFLRRVRAESASRRPCAPGQDRRPALAFACSAPADRGAQRTYSAVDSGGPCRVAAVDPQGSRALGSLTTDRCGLSHAISRRPCAKFAVPRGTSGKHRGLTLVLAPTRTGEAP
jgi:hypothetical protein